MWPWRWGLLFLLGLGLTACSGSGSSGFDGPHNDTLSPTRLAENALIAGLLQDSTCIECDGLLVCPTDADLTPEGVVVSSTPAEPHFPETMICQQDRTGAPCRLALTFTLEGFAPASTFRVAARPVVSNAPWLVGKAHTVTSTPQTFRLDAVVRVPPPEFADADFEVQLAVLVVTDATTPLPRQFAQLEESGADLAFVATRTVQLAFGRD
jgi:hypothetical protein